MIDSDASAEDIGTGEDLSIAGTTWDVGSVLRFRGEAVGDTAVAGELKSLTQIMKVRLRENSVDY